jgi:sec-independent protein translocase protein TatC
LLQSRFRPLPCPSTRHAPLVQRNYNEDLFESSKMTFGEHLEELRSSLLKAVLSLVIGVLIGLIFGRQLVDYIQTPLRAALRDHYREVDDAGYRKYLEQRQASGLPVPENVDAAVQAFSKLGLFSEERYFDPRQVEEALGDRVTQVPNAKPYDGSITSRDELINLRIYHDAERDQRLQLIGTGSQDAFIAYMKGALVLGAVMASPFIFYFIWQFIAAGLYPHEQRYVHIFLPFSILLFLAGAALAFFFAFKYVLGFLLWFYESMNIDPELRISDWLSFVLFMPLGFGISFQLPLVMLFLERIGIFTVSTYLSHWRMVVLVIAVISMILTPAEPYSMMLMCMPLIGLYFFGVALCKWMPKRTTPFGDVIE